MFVHPRPFRWRACLSAEVVRIDPRPRLRMGLVGPSFGNFRTKQES